jgi:carboxyl-terminal processing protease
MKITSHTILAAFILILGISGAACASLTGRDRFAVFDQAVSIIENNHIDANRRWVKLDTSWRPDIGSLVAQLAGRADHVSSTEIQKQQDIPGGVVGFQVGRTENEYRVVDVLEDYAAQKGLRRGDTILEIDHEPAADLPFPKLLWKLTGKPGTEVILKIRTSDNETKEVTIIRTEKQYVSFVLLQMIGDGIGYLRINGFNDETPFKVSEGIRAALDENNMQALVLDLRANHGGLFIAILKTAELFLKQDDAICTLIRGGNVETTYKAERSSDHPEFPIVVLVDDNTSWGAELFTAALKENKRATVAGVRTSGRGEMLTVYPLKDGSQLTITTAYMYSPTREPIHGSGIMPDREISLSDEDKRRLYGRINYASNDINADIAADLQLKTAVGMLNEEIQNRKKTKKPQ